MPWPPSWPRPRATSSALTRMQRSAFFERVTSGTKMGLIFEVAEGGFLTSTWRCGRAARKRGPRPLGGWRRPGARAGPAWRAGPGGRRPSPGRACRHPATPNGPFPRTRPAPEPAGRRNRCLAALDSQFERLVLGTPRRALSTRRRVSSLGPGGATRSCLADGRSRSGQQLLPFLAN